MTYMTDGALGVDPAVTTTTQDFGLGERHSGADGTVWTYVHANGAISQYAFVVIDEAWEADEVETTNSATSIGQSVGLAEVAFADNEYGWVKVSGVFDNGEVGSSCAANTVINSTATAGRLDDDATVGAEVITGVVLTTAESSGNVAPGYMSFPVVGATL